MKLIVFDLDQTIIDLVEFHDKATYLSLKKVFGIDAWLHEIDYGGNTIKKNLITLARLKGIKNKQLVKIPRAVNLYDKFFISVVPKNISRFLLPGAEKLIKELSKNKENYLILLTGDSEKISKEVLKKTGLLHYFHFLVTGEHTKSRIKLMKKAVKKAYRKTMQEKFEKIIVLGDSTHDIEAGKAVNAVTISLLTGIHTKKQLEKKKTDYIFKNLNNKKILEIIEK